MDLPFDLYALVNPKTQADRDQLLAEAILAAEDLKEAVLNLHRVLDQSRKAK